MNRSNVINSFAGSFRFFTHRLHRALRRLPAGHTLAVALLGATGVALPVSAQDWSFVNPLYFGGYGAVPGLGTSLELSPEGFVARTEEEAILIGLLVPAVLPTRPHVEAFDLITDVPPDTLTLKPSLPQLWGKGKTVKIDFCKTDAGKIDAITPTPEYEVHGDFPLGAEIQVHFYRDGVNVHDISVTKQSDALFRVERVPDLIAPLFELMPSSAQRSMVTSVTVTFDAQFRGGVFVAVSDVNGDSVRFIADRAVIYMGLECQTNLEKVGAGTLILDAGGIQTMIVSPRMR